MSQSSPGDTISLPVPLLLPVLRVLPLRFLLPLLLLLLLLLFSLKLREECGKGDTPAAVEAAVAAISTLLLLTLSSSLPAFTSFFTLAFLFLLW